VTTQAEKAEVFRALHHGSEVLVLTNAWDCASARVFEEAGFPAIATTSAGIANAMGYVDGDRIPVEEMLAMVRRIAGCVAVPVTADLEGGYQDVARTAAGMIEAGAIGLNLEDGGGDAEELARRVATVRRVGRELGVNPVINARTDLYLNQVGDPATRFERACERLLRYIAAGADCVFVPGVTDEETIRRLVEALRFPLNVLATAGLPGVGRLKELGVARVSVGSGIARAALGWTQHIAADLKRTGSWDEMWRRQISYADANRLFER
jgi:2-methylisocitrate lyase-like PEP mutase family enzyme